MYGKNYFGKMLCNSLEKGINIISDGGFKEELQLVINEIGADHVLVIQIYRDDCSFDNDSRNYFYEADCEIVHLYNNSTLKKLFYNVEKIINNWINTNSKRF